MFAAGNGFWDDKNGCCKVKPFRSCLQAYYRWVWKKKEYVSMSDTSFLYQDGLCDHGGELVCVQCCLTFWRMTLCSNCAMMHHAAVAQAR